MAFVEDFTVFFNTDEFAVIATPSVGAPVTVIFDRAQIEALGGDISGTAPVALALSADVASWTPHSTTLVIAGADHHPPRSGNVTYKLRDIQPDGTGTSTLVLQEA